MKASGVTSLTCSHYMTDCFSFSSFPSLFQAAVSNQSDNKSGSSKTSTLQKSTTQEEEKKIETAVSRLERREQLKKSNTLPTSVTGTVRDSDLLQE